MIEILKKEYWSRADAFLLPLTGLSKNEKLEMKSYLFWNEYSIQNYNLVISISCDVPEIAMEYCRNVLFPILDKNGYLIENYDVEGRSIFILDMSQWAEDIELFLNGKYSRLSKRAKYLIEKWHLIDVKRAEIPARIYSVLYPNKPMTLLDGMTAIEYIAENYGFSLEELTKIGEIGSLYDQMPESLITDVSELC